MTVVEMPGEETGPNAAVMKEATKAVAGGGMIKFDIEHRVRAVYGRQLGVAGANGGYTYVAYSTGITGCIRSRATPLSREGRQKLTRCASSNHSI